MARFSSWPRGWRRGILLSCLCSSAVLVLNLAATAVAAVSTTDSDGRVLFKGNCEMANNLNRGIHIVINVLGTLVLASSNYAMQCLSAPTRAEVDACHKLRIWLHIGVMGVRNLWRIHWSRRLLWFLLGVSSLPFHLL